MKRYLLFCLLFLAACSGQQLVEVGDTVTVDYVGTLIDGTVFDDSSQRGPLTFTVGSGEMIEGFDKGVMGMAVDITKKIEVRRDEGYGYADPQLIRDVPRTAVTSDSEIQIGAIFIIQGPDGTERPARIVNMSNETLTMDLNHPLAGQDLFFEVTLREIVRK